MDKTWEVEKLISRKRQHGRYLYRVRWKGFTPDEDTWEPASNLNGLEKDFNKQRKLRKKIKPTAGKVCTCHGHEKLNISDDELETKLRALEEELEAIRNGSLQSDCHTKYMAGGSSRRMLDHTAHLCVLEDGQEDIVMRVLMSMFSSNTEKLKNLDYLMRVILPEALLRICRQSTVNGQPEDEHTDSHSNDPSRSSERCVQEDASPDENCSSEDEWKPEKKRKHSSDSDSSDSGSESDIFEERHERRLQDSHDNGVGCTVPDATSPMDSREQRKKTHVPRKRTSVGSKRVQKDCPVKGCTGKVVNMSRHFQQIHPDIPQSEIEELRQRPQPKRSFPKRMCCMTDCNWVGTRPARHLQRVHNMTKADSSELAKNCNKQQHPKNQGVGSGSGSHLHTAESLSEEFFHWYSSLEGGSYISPELPPLKQKKKEEQNRRQQTMCKQVLEKCFGGEPFSMSNIVLLKTIGRRCDGKESVIEKLKGDKTWGTVKNYLASLNHFLDFLQACYGGKISIDIAGIRSCLMCITRSVNKFVAEELQRRKLKAQDQILSENIIAQYINYDLARKLTSEAKKKKGATDLSGRERLRNHLILRTAFHNAKRSGILADLKCSQVRNPRRTDSGLLVVLVDDGKTFRSAGAAGLHFTPDEHEQFLFYIDHVRPSCETDHVFCTSEGKQRDSSFINSCLQAGFDDFGKILGIEVPHVTSTIIRKTVITLCREKNRSREEQLCMAQHMDHSVETADRNYDVSTGIQNTAQFWTIMQTLITGWQQDFEEQEEEKGEEEEGEADHKENGEDIEFHDEENTKSESSALHTSCMRFGKPEVFTKEDKERVRRCCKKLIDQKVKDKGPVRCQEVVRCLQHSGIAFQDLFTFYTEKQLYSRVRTEIRKARLSV